MDKSYVIHWRSKVNGRSGIGTTRFSKEEADTLAAELNRDFPEIEHEAIHGRAAGAMAKAIRGGDATGDDETPETHVDPVSAEDR